MNQQHRPLGVLTEPSAVYVALGDSICIHAIVGSSHVGCPGRGQDP